jgi:hypothetical protein
MEQVLMMIEPGNSGRPQMAAKDRKFSEMDQAFGQMSRVFVHSPIR